jgi:hypothetical protein
MSAAGHKTGLLGAMIFGSIFLCGYASAADITVNSSFSVKPEYNDNIFFDVNNEVDDFITTFTPELNVVKKTERLDAVLTGRIDGIAYADNDEFNAFEQYYSGRFAYAASQRTRIGASASFKRDSRPDRDLVVITDIVEDLEVNTTGLVFGTSDRNRLRFGASADFEISEKALQIVKYSFQNDDFNNPGLVDSTSHTFELGLRYNLGTWFPLTSGRLNAGYTLIDSDNSELRKLDFSAGVERQIHELLRFFVDIGVGNTKTEFINPTVDDSNWAWIGRMGLAYKGEMSRLGLVLSHDVSGLSGARGGTERTRLVLTGNRGLTGNIWGRITVGYYLNTSGQNEYTVNTIDTQTFRIKPAVNYAFTRDIQFELSDSYTRVRDRNADTSKNQNVVMGKFLFLFPIVE